MRSTMPVSGSSVPNTDSSVIPSTVSCCKDSGGTTFDAGDLLYGEPRLLRQLGQLGRAAQPVLQALPRGPEHLPLFP